MNNWKEIKREEDISSIIEKSHERTQIIFKDSTTCGISAHAKDKLINGNDKLVDKADFNYLDLLAYRSISNLIAEKLEIRHQSPQIIVLKNGVPTHTVTHHSIHPETLEKHL